ncbi:hypothetical protein AAT17_10775 [Nonlabens sp. MIC269]|uniref:ABC transporter ATP-binding protein n=1 Tax=Nonlabens sp. MIC269 TaxID=1476901 RepID=UPI0007210D21|nr:ABC transporter ATP-binding protein [Nonlabens sp. MIC269]ALM21681.1 hypothetical protein AAT17_10775 [Nonlabens sp. MIC269]
MSDVILKVENISKQYRLGKVGTGTLGHDLNRFWARLLGKEDPYLQVGAVNDRSKAASSQYVWALQNINFEVERGEILGIIGKNGAGKSTLLKILSRVTAPTTGSIKTRGRIASLLEVGTGMHPELTGRENIFLNGAILGMTKAEIASKIDEIVEFSGCEMYINTPVKRYSSGMRVRLGFAVAAFLEPDILVVDEVLAVGDAEFQKKAIGKMQDVSSQGGRTVLFVSHNMAAIKNLCNRGIVMDNGEIVFVGDSSDSVDRYLYLNRKEPKSLVSREDRKGNFKFKILSLGFFNDSGQRVDEILSGSNCLLKFDYEINDTVNLSHLTFVIQILNSNGDFITTLASDETGFKFDHLSEKGTISFQIERLLLRAGNYTIKYHFSEKISFLAPHETLDLLDYALDFTVMKNDVYKSGVDLRANGFIQDFKVLID